MTEDITKRARNILTAHFGVPADKLDVHTHLVNDLDFDTLDCIELIILCEDEFGIEISDAEAEDVKTVMNAVALIEKHCGAVAS